MQRDRSGARALPTRSAELSRGAPRRAAHPRAQDPAAPQAQAARPAAARRQRLACRAADDRSGGGSKVGADLTNKLNPIYFAITGEGRGRRCLNRAAPLAQHGSWRSGLAAGQAAAPAAGLWVRDPTHHSHGRSTTPRSSSSPPPPPRGAAAGGGAGGGGPPPPVPHTQLPCPAAATALPAVARAAALAVREAGRGLGHL